MALIAQLAQPWRGLSRNTWLIAASMLLWSMGLALYDPLLSIHLINLGADPTTVGSIFSAAYLIVALTSIPAGLLADRFDRKTLMILFWSIGTPSVLIISLAQTWQQSLVGIAMYFTSFMGFPAVNAYLTDGTEPQHLARSFALMYTTFPAAQLIGPSLGGYIAERWNIQTVFWLSFLFYLASTLTVAQIKPQQPGAGDKSRFQLKQAWRILHETPRFRLMAVIAGLAYISLTALTRFTSPFLQDVRGLGLFSIGVLNSIIAAGGMLFAALLGHLAKRDNQLSLLSLCLAVYASALVMVAWTPNLLLLGLAFLLLGLIFPARSMIDASIGSLSQGKQTGLIFGLFGLFIGLGQSIAPAVGGVLYTFSTQASFILVGLAGFALAAWIYANRGAVHEP